MPQIFHRSWNVISRLSIFGAIFFLAAASWIAAIVVRSSYATDVGVPVDQPVQFSHEHHVGQLRIDCRYCHGTVEYAAFAGIPSTGICMNCHSQIWVGSPMLEPVRSSYRTGVPLVWNRVHDLGDFAHFNHSIHVQKGFGCVTCHGQVDRMPLTWKAQTLHMEWCLDCHRRPEQYIRPREEVFNMAWKPPIDQQNMEELARRLSLDVVPANQLALGQALVEKYEVRRITNCSICHH